MIPQEVLAKVSGRFGSLSYKLGREPFGCEKPEDEFDPQRIVFYPKSEVSKVGAWIETVRSKRALFVEKANGWRKCHTDNYWCYYAKELPKWIPSLES